MRKFMTFLAAAFVMITAPAAAQVTLYDQTNLPQQFVTPLSLSFTADSATTTLNFQGYQLPGSLALVNLYVTLTGTAPILGGSNNLLDTNYLYTPAPVNPFATEGSLGIYGANDLVFGGYSEGSYDTFSQTFSTAIGSSYTLGLSFTNVGQGPNGLRISTGDLFAVPAVPEPATWAMMLVGFGAIGFAMRRRRKLNGNASFA